MNEQFFSHACPEPNTGCLLWTGPTDARGYGVFWHSQYSKNFAHRLAVNAAHGVCVLHKCDTPSCVNPEHLEFGTRRENNRQRDERGRHVALRGEHHGRAKLTAADVIAIREDGREQRAIAADYQISQAMVWRIKSRLAWRHIA